VSIENGPMAASAASNAASQGEAVGMRENLDCGRHPARAARTAKDDNDTRSDQVPRGQGHDCLRVL